MRRVVFVALFMFAGTFVLADNCGSESDCEAVPGNTDAATGMAAAGAGTAALTATAFISRRREEEEVDPVEFDPEEETGEDDSLEHLFGTPDPPAETEGGTTGGGPPDRPLGEDPISGETGDETGRSGPPDGPLGE